MTSADEWNAACEVERATRLERFREIALREAEKGGDVAAKGALERWRPRGRDGAARGEPVADADRGVILDVVRRAVAVCGLEDTVALTTELVRFQTVAAVAPPDENPEFLALAVFLERWCNDAGLEFRIHGAHDAYEVVLPGRNDGRALSFIAHADVAPIGDPPAFVAPGEVPTGWTVPPYEARVVEERLYGRGTEDDKGPIAAALIVLATLADAGLVPERDVVLAMGTGEEHDWDGMKRYAEEAPVSDNYVSIDAEFPVVVAEDGFVEWGLQLPAGEPPAESARPVALHVNGGLFLTQVPDSAESWLRPGTEDAEALRAGAERAIAARVAEWGADAGFSGEVEIAEREGTPAVVIRAHGRSVHSSTPEGGANALWLLARVAHDLELAPGGIATVLGVLDEYFVDDLFGEKIGLAYSDPLMGPLIVAPTVLRVENGIVRLEVNMRRPAGRSPEEFQAGLDALLGRLRQEFGESLARLDGAWVGSPSQVDPASPLVQELLDVYRAVSGDASAQPVGLRGGTYARLFPGAVSFGPCLPGEPYRGHGGDETIELRALDLTVRALLEATIRLSF